MTRILTNRNDFFQNTSVTITTPLLYPCDNVLRLLERCYKFIPTPSGCCHKAIFKGVHDFLRKYKWHHALAGRSCRFTAPNRFLLSSSTEPPGSMVPRHILRKCRLIMNVVLTKLRACSSCFPRDNLSVAERHTLHFLMSQKDFTVSPVDKGGGWFLTPTDEYNNEAFRQLCNYKFYSPCDDSFNRVTSIKLTRLLQHLYDTRFINKREFSALAPPETPRDRLFYLLPKIHKPEWPTPLMPPGRPIGSDCSSVSRKCASLVEHFLAPIARRLPSFVRDSMHVISIIKNFSLP